MIRRRRPTRSSFRSASSSNLVPNEGPCGFFFGYTQRALWNAYAASSPFEDTNYNPQFFFVFGLKDISALRSLPPAGRLDFHWARLGAEHESNGKGGADSREWNRIFISARFVLVWGGNAFYWMLEPKILVALRRPGEPRPGGLRGLRRGQHRFLGWHVLLNDGGGRTSLSGCCSAREPWGEEAPWS